MKKKNKREGEVYKIDTDKGEKFIKKELKKIKNNKTGFRTLGVDEKNNIIVNKYYPPEKKQQRT